MSVKTGTCGYSYNPLTGAFSGSEVVFRPAIGERGRITLSNPTGRAGFYAYSYLNSTTLGEIYDGYLDTTHTDYSCVFDYVRKGDGKTTLTYVSGNAGALAVIPSDTNGDIYLVAGLDTFPAAPIDPGAPYTNASGLVALSKNPSSGSYKSAGGADYSSTYTIFNAFWAKGSNRIAGDEGNNV